MGCIYRAIKKEFSLPVKKVGRIGRQKSDLAVFRQMGVHFGVAAEVILQARCDEIPLFHDPAARRSELSYLID